MKRSMDIRKTGIAAVLVLVMLVSLTNLFPTGAAAETGETRQFETEEAALAWKAEVEAAYQQKDDGYDYTLIWDGPNRIVVGTETVLTEELVPVGDPVVTGYGPYETLEEAQAALEEEIAKDPSAPLRQVVFSDIFTTAGEGGEIASFVSEDYPTEAERDAALEEKLRELESSGMVPDPSSVQGSEELIGVTVEGLTKDQTKAASYAVPASSYIVVKQADWFFIWTPEDLGGQENELLRQVQERDGSLAATRFKGFYSGFDLSITFPEEAASGIYTFAPNGDGFLLTVYGSDGVENGDKVSHVDYGSYSLDKRYWFELSYRIPPVAYAFTKTVQEYEQKEETVQIVRYEIGYSVTATPKETEPPETDPPVTEPPVTEPPETDPPVTEPPETEPPATEPSGEPPAPNDDDVPIGSEPETTVPPDRSSAEAPRTGDPISLWGMMSILSGLGLAGLTIPWKKDHE